MFSFDSERVHCLREKAVSPFISYDEFYLHFYRYLKNAQGSLEDKLSNAWKFAFENIHPSIDEKELIVGKCDYRLSDAEQSEYDGYKKNLIDEYALMCGQDSHMAIDYDLVLNEGIEGIIQKIDHLSANCNVQKAAFYRSVKTCLLGVIAYSNRYSAHALSLSESESDPERKKELKEISEICARVPRYPARTFHEAIQSAHFISLALSFSPLRPYSMQQFQLGRPDRYLYPFYERDLRSGVLTQKDAQTLIDLLAIQINHRVPHGLSSGYMVGGRDKNGVCTVNDLTYMFLQAIDDVHLVYPSVGLCYVSSMPEDVLTYACQILSKGYSHPAIFNDELIQKGLLSYGVLEGDAPDYIHSTCVEITPVAGSNVWVASPYTNMLSLLLDRMDKEYTSFDELLNVILHDLDRKIEENFLNENACRILRYEKCRHPFLSAFVNDCLETGTDIEQGGARYNWIMPSFVGMANLVDSLYAIKKLVFEEKKFSIYDLKKASDADFEGFENLRLLLLNKIDKYGNDVDEVDELFTQIVNHIISECRKHTPVYQNAHLIPSVFCWVMHELMGRETGASPDGRRAGFPLGDGSGPCQGRERNGPTASILSSTKWPHMELIGGVAVNMKFAKKTFSSSSLEKVKTLIKTYIARGGFEIQINVVDLETLLDARKHPELYQDLVVRIGGYSDYFVRISPEMQSEIIERTAHVV